VGIAHHAREEGRWAVLQELREAVTLVIECNRELAEQSLRGQAVTREPLGQTVGNVAT
jgi:hypothetical protein